MLGREVPRRPRLDGPGMVQVALVVIAAALTVVALVMWSVP